MPAVPSRLRQYPLSRPIPLPPLIGPPALSQSPFRVLSNFQPGPIFSARTPGKRFFDPLPKKILRLRTRRIMRARQKDPRAGAFRFRGRGRVCARARLDFARAGAFRLFFASWLSCFGLWPGPVVWACGLGLWPGLVVWACGLGLWPGLVAWACGLGRLAHTAHGTNQVHVPPISPRSPGVRSATLPAHCLPTAGPSCLAPTDAPRPAEGVLCARSVVLVV